MSLPGLLPDLEVLRKDFPILSRSVAGGEPLVYLDSANTSQKPQVVIDTMVDHLERHNANVARAVQHATRAQCDVISMSLGGRAFFGLERAINDAVRRDIIVLCHGGPIALPEDAQYILANCPQCHGFYGASSMERLPTEVALTEQTRRFKAISRQ